MQNIILIMNRKPIAENLIYRLKDNSKINLIHEHNYNISKSQIHTYDAKTALIEVTESDSYNINYCLKLCKKFRREAPKCKLILMCSEKDEKSIKGVIKAKEKKEIDDFVFYDVTIEYLVSKLGSI